MSRVSDYKSVVEKWAKKHGVSYKSALSIISEIRGEVYEWVDFDQLANELVIAFNEIKEQ